MFKIDHRNVDNLTQVCFNKIIVLLDTYASLKRSDKDKLELPWITSGLQKSVCMKKKIPKFINKTDPMLKEDLYMKYKNCRLTKKSRGLK